jgi:hypothetical protein
LIDAGSDGTTLMSGSSVALAAALASLRLNSATGISGALLSIEAVAVSKANTNGELCGSAGESRTVLVQPLGLGMNTKKVPVKIKG